MIKPFNQSKTISQLQAKIIKLEKEKAQLRAGLYEILEIAYRAVNQESAKEVNRE